MKSPGVTLVEMLVILLIIGILLAISSINYLRWINMTRADAAAAEVGRFLERASTQVRRTNKDVTLTIDSTGKKIDLSQKDASSADVVFASTTLDATVSSVTCRPSCTAATSSVKAVAPFGGFVNDAATPVTADIKMVVARAGFTRSVYALGPSALLKVVRN